MNIKNFDLNLLMVLERFLRKNVTKASKKLGITQPAMSTLEQIKIFVKDELLIRDQARDQLREPLIFHFLLLMLLIILN